MNASKPDYLNCSSEVVGGLVETLCIALMDTFPRTMVDRGDVGLMLDAVHVLRPDVTEIDALDSILLILSGHWDDATRMLRYIESRVPNFVYAKALLAFTLAAKGDQDWFQYAGMVLETGNPCDEAARLVRALVARYDRMIAQRKSRTGGGVAMPESAAALLAESEQPDGAAASGKEGESGEQESSHTLYQGYIRA